MKFKSTVIKPLARRIAARVQKDSLRAVSDQDAIFKQLMKKGGETIFGMDHGFDQVTSHSDFINQVSVRDYESSRSYIDRVVAGEANVLWPGRPKYWAKTSGTTSGSKYIPITRDSMPNHFNTARNALFCQANRLNRFSFVDGKMIFLSGSPKLEQTNGIPTGRLSGIVNHAVPSWLRGNQLPSYETNCLEDWDEKIEAIITETLTQKMTLISGIPPWVKDYFERLIARSGKETIAEIFPDLEFVAHGGVNFEPYRSAFDDLIGRPYDSVETYPASEGFFAFQDQSEEDGLLLNTNSGIFFEFIPTSEIHNDNPSRLSLAQVDLDVNYALILSSNAGLWAYNIGDTVEFVGLNPYRIRVTGRIKHFISSFGEHVISKEIEEAIKEATALQEVQVSAFTVAPVINNEVAGASRHQWIIEFASNNPDLTVIAGILDESVRRQNSYYDDLRRSRMLREAELIAVPPGTFSAFMRSQGKQGGQNKIPILSNDRVIADGILDSIS